MYKDTVYIIENQLYKILTNDKKHDITINSNFFLIFFLVTRYDFLRPNFSWLLTQTNCYKFEQLGLI